MGTTLTIGYLIADAFYVAHAGDSRFYLLHGGELRQITRDHTVASELVARGAMEADAAPVSQLRHVVTNVIGGGVQSVYAEVHKIPVVPGDVVLLCSDGLSEMVSDEDIAFVLRSQADPVRACQRLIDAANDAGGRDNVTAIVARVEAADG